MTATILTPAPIARKAEVFMLLRDYMGNAQRCAIHSALRGEERAYFRQLLSDYVALVQAMPATYETQGEHIAYLHYFTGSADFYITEKDAGCSDDEPGIGQVQAFGLADLFHDGGELGYISLPEITAAGAELDLHWTPRPLSEIRAERAA